MSEDKKKDTMAMIYDDLRESGIDNVHDCIIMGKDGVESGVLFCAQGGDPVTCLGLLDVARDKIKNQIRSMHVGDLPENKIAKLSADGKGSLWGKPRED